VLDDVIPVLACPLCGRAIARSGGAVRCSGGGHAFDVARQGYVNLLPGDARPGTADTAEMVAARERFLAGGYYAGLAALVAERAAAAWAPGGGCVVDAGAGTGYLLARVLDALPGGPAGLALDLSTHAARRAARAHPRIGAVVTDTWQRFPVRDGVAGLVLNAFAPRNGPELRRVLRDDGALLVVTPAPDHLGELVAALGLLTVDARKPERLAGTLDRWFTLDGTAGYSARLRLDADTVRAVVAMGPSARHGAGPDREAALAALPDPVTVTAAVTVSAYRPK
jgi:23S rRNA (guanine745-N1)-methyltransferase